MISFTRHESAFPLYSSGVVEGIFPFFHYNALQGEMQMRNVVLVICALVFSLMIAHPVAAEPTIFGPTGLLVNPTADIAAEEHAWIAINFLDNDGNAIWFAEATGAISENLEAGIGAVHPDDGDDGITFFAKWLFLPEEENMPGAAAGLTVTDIAGNNQSMYYVVFSKFFYIGENASENASIHLGGCYMTGDNDDDFEFFGGVDVEIVEDMILLAEYNSDDESLYQGLAFGVRYYVGEQFTMQGGLVDGDLLLGTSFVF